MQKTMVLWDNAHYTQNDNHALNSWCFKKAGDSRTVAFDGKVEKPWLEAKTKQVLELAVLKIEIKCVGDYENDTYGNQHETLVIVGRGKVT